MALVPYSESNLKLAFDPNQFLNDLDRLTDHSRKNMQVAYHRAIKKGWINVDDNQVKLSLEARQSVELFMAPKITNAQLMIIFDIPEDKANLRRRFRGLLKYLQFKQIQQSVWVSERDYQNIIIETIYDLGLSDWVLLYEAAPIDT